MQVNVQLTPDQVLTLSKDMQAAMPTIIAQAVPGLIQHLLTEKGAHEEREAFKATLPKLQDTWQTDRRAEQYVTLRQAVINAMVEPAKEAFANHPELNNVAQVLALWLIENKREVMSEGFLRFFERMWRNMAESAGSGELLSAGLVQVLKDKNFLRQDEADQLRSQVRNMVGGPS